MPPTVKRIDRIEKPKLPTTAVRSLVRACAATAIGKLDQTPAAKVVKREWSDDRGAEWLTRSPTSAISTETAPDLVRAIMPDLIATLAPKTAAVQLFRKCLRVTFGSNGRAEVPTILGDASYAGFVAEGAPKPVVQGKVEPLLVLTPHKLVTIIVLTKEMVRSSNVEALMTDALIRSTGLALDKVLFDDQPASDARPAGLRYGLAPLAASTAPDPTAALLQDLETLARATADVTTTLPVYVTYSVRAMMAELRAPHGLESLTMIGTHAVKDTNQMFAISSEAFVSGFGEVPEVTSSSQAALAMSNTPEGERPVFSIWQNDCIAILVRLPITWGLRAPNGVAWLVATNW